MLTIFKWHEKPIKMTTLSSKEIYGGIVESESSAVFTVFELPGGWGVKPPYLTLPTPYLWSKFDPGGSSLNPPPKFC